MTRRRRAGDPAARDPVPLADSVAAVGRELGMPEPSVLTDVISVWPELVGSALAAHASVRSIRDGTCTIAVDGPEWATQLRYLETELLDRMSERWGPGVLRHFRVIVVAPGRTVL